MACKLICPKCKLSLKEEGDRVKPARGEYRVYENLWNSESEEGQHRLILCLACRQAGEVWEFDVD